MTKSDNSVAKVNPTAGYLLIEPAEQSKQTASGIYLADNASGEKPQTGTVLAVGPEEVTDSGLKKTPPAKKGDKVIYKKWGGNEVKIDNKEYLFVKAEDILAVIN
jgi:chaperonin GroES